MPGMSKQYAKYLQEYKEHFSLEEIQQQVAISRELLLSIRPEKIVMWFQSKAHGKVIIGEHDQPKGCQSNTLVSYKKGLCHFMPRQMSPWDPVNEFGNPTRSEALNAVISKFKKVELRKQDVETSALLELWEAILINPLVILSS